MRGEKGFQRFDAIDEDQKKDRSKKPAAEEVDRIVDAEINAGKTDQQNVKEAERPSDLFVFEKIDEEAAEEKGCLRGAAGESEIFWRKIADSGNLLAGSRPLEKILEKAVQ